MLGRQVLSHIWQPSHRFVFNIILMQLGRMAKLVFILLRETIMTNQYIYNLGSQILWQRQLRLRKRWH